MVVPLTARESADICPPEASSPAVPVMKWWVLLHNISCSMHHRLPTPSHPRAMKLFDQLVDVSYDNSRWNNGHVMIMVMTIPWRRSQPQSKSLLSRAQMQLHAPLAVASTQHSEAPVPVCFLTGLSACMLENSDAFWCAERCNQRLAALLFIIHVLSVLQMTTL